ncbi:MAG: hypothetical protein JRJ49_03500 [Deltaproteobacteria bacterium]|nr:hypothetical protein [Deltaproteobacteria bacterium]
MKIGKMNICKIKIFLNIIILLILFNLSNSSFALVVSDPTSYSYYVNQIKKMTEQLKIATEQAQDVKKIYDTNNETLNQLKGVYQAGKTAINEFSEQIEIAKQIGSAVDKYRKKAQDGDVDFVDAKEIMRDIFKDARKNPESVFEDAERRYQVEQTAIEDVILDADSILNAMPTRFDIVQDLLLKSSQTENVKEAMDLQNRISVEILQVLLEMLSFSAKVNQAENILRYQGADEATTAERIKKQEEINKRTAEDSTRWMIEDIERMKKQKMSPAVRKFLEQ